MCKLLNNGLFILATLTVASAKILRRSNLNAPADWWQTAVFYQIYPRSFKDANNDGVGDLQGVIEKLPYLKDTGITAAWLSPIFRSPQVDQGYDISDYRDIDPIFGTMDDLKELLDRAHELDLKIILDFVPNHTSDKHHWFINSVNKTEGYEDYYIWANPQKDANGDNLPPNNWISMFQDSAWTWNEQRQQYYLHQFTPAQPDLNYNNPKVVQEMKDILTYWLDLGVDGFRIDAVPYLFEDLELRDEPVLDSNGTSYDSLEHIYTKDLNATYDMIYQWRELVDNYLIENGGETRVLMTEAYTTPENTVLYYGNGDRLGAHFTFNFNLVSNINYNSTAIDIYTEIRRWFELLPMQFTPNWVLGNHDNHRVATRLGPENVDGFNTLLAMLPGVQVTYNGEEIGQEDGEVTCEEGMDPSAIKNCTTFDAVSRDFERTPFQWDTTVNAGFNDGAEPWLPVSKKANDTNLAAQNVEGTVSHYNNYKAILKLKQIFTYDMWEYGADSEGLLEVHRESDTGIIGFFFNIGSGPREHSVADGSFEVLLTSVNSDKKVGDVIQDGTIIINPHESVVLRILLTNVCE